MKRHQSRKLREKIAAQYAGRKSKEWTEEESFQLARQWADRDKQAIESFFEKKYGKILPAIWNLTGEYRDCAGFYVVEKDGVSLKIQTPIYRFNLPVGFINIETAETWAERVNGKVEKRFDRTDRLNRFLNGENLEHLDVNLNDFYGRSQ